MEKTDSQKKVQNKKWISKSHLFLFIISLIILCISFKHKKVALFIIISILVIKTIIKTIIFIIKKKDKEKSIKAGFEEPWNLLYGDTILNISYAKNNIIINSFKENGDNYKKDIRNSDKV